MRWPVAGSSLGMEVLRQQLQPQVQAADAGVVGVQQQLQAAGARVGDAQQRPQAAVVEGAEEVQPQRQAVKAGVGAVQQQQQRQQQQRQHGGLQGCKGGEAWWCHARHQRQGGRGAPAAATASVDVADALMGDFWSMSQRLRQ